METSIASCARGALLPGVTSQHSTTALATLRSISTPFSSRSLKSSSLFGESLRIMPKSSYKVLKTKNPSPVTKCEIGDSLEEFLAKATPDKGLIRLMMCMGEAIRTIAFKVRTASCGGTACVNSFGDEQLAVDMLADKLLFESLTHSHYCKYACSEEVPELQDMGGPVEGGFSVAFDPLDGSSIVDTNFTVGTIFGVWPGDKLTGVTGRDQVAAAMGIYGPRTTYVLALKDIPGTHEFLLLDEGKWQHVKDTTEIGEGKMFSPGNLRATFDNPDYDKLINYYVKEKYTLRYTGGMVPDVNQENKVGNKKWKGSVGGIVDAPLDKVWTMVSLTKRLPEWMPMVERCTNLEGEEGIPGYVRLVSGFMFPQEDGDRSWIKERLVSMDPLSHSYVYTMEASNVGLDGSLNSLMLVDYGDNSTLVDWSFEINPLEGSCEDIIIDYLGFLYKSCINRIEGALEASFRESE